jgi:hypothetical protein
MRLEFTYQPEDFAEWSKAAGKRPGMRPHFARSLITWLVFIGLAVVIFLWLPRENARGPQPLPPAVPARPVRDRVFDMLIGLVPWVVVFCVIWFFVYRQMRAGRGIWNKDKTLQQPHALLVDDESVTLSGSTASTRWLWAAFAGWTETANLILLRQTDDVTVLVPKRAATPAELDELRGLLRRHIVPPTGGFPVNPPVGHGANAGDRT